MKKGLSGKYSILIAVNSRKRNERTLERHSDLLVGLVIWECTEVCSA